MNTKDKVFLARADAVTEKRIEKLQDRLAPITAAYEDEKARILADIS